MKEIFIVTSYYHPEIGAAANRIQHMAEGLVEKGFKVTVITPLPNYPTGKIFKDFRGKIKDSSSLNGVKLIRLWIFASNSENKILRLLAMLSYSFSLLWYYLFNKIPNTVIVQCPPLLVAFTSMVLLKKKKRKLILNVSDLWPLAGLELGALKEGFFVSLLRKIERYNYKSADLVLGQSNEILKHVLEIEPNKPIFLYRNYPVFRAENFSPKLNAPSNLNLVYAGLLGIAQGIYEVCTNINYTGMAFHIYGDGAERPQIEAFIEDNPNLPITYHGNVSRADLHKEIIKYDLALIPLKRRIYGSVPSKIFEYAKLGLPLMYFGGGEGEDIVKQYSLGYVAEPTNYEQLNSVLSKIKVSGFEDSFKNDIKVTAEKYFRLSSQLDDLAKLLWA